jgi:RND family efflux transporter MFP subunit
MTLHEEPPKRDHDLGFALPEPAKLSPQRAVALGVVAIVVLGGAFLVGWLPRHRAQETLAAETKGTIAESQRVQVITPKVAKSDRSLALPGSITPLEETVIYPRASGYVRKWYVDIGDKPKEGDLLAEIDTPELDQQLVAARADLARAEAGLVQSKANADFSKTNLGRYEALTPTGVTSQQELDQHKSQSLVDDANVTVAKANVDSQKANVARILDLKTFGRVTAPFAGTITARWAERGALVTAGNGTPLFKLSTTDPMRVLIQVPQDVSPSIQVGLVAKIAVREYPGRTFDGTVAHSAGALDATTRTMAVEVRVPNPKNELLSGMYGQVAFSLPTPHRVYELPATALLVDAKGVRVSVVAADGTIHYLPVVIERDTGPTVEIASGLDGSERVVKLASADLVEGKKVDAQP